MALLLRLLLFLLPAWDCRIVTLVKWSWADLRTFKRERSVTRRLLPAVIITDSSKTYIWLISTRSISLLLWSTYDPEVSSFNASWKSMLENKTLNVQMKCTIPWMNGATKKSVQKLWCQDSQYFFWRKSRTIIDVPWVLVFSRVLFIILFLNNVVFWIQAKTSWERTFSLVTTNILQMCYNTHPKLLWSCPWWSFKSINSWRQNPWQFLWNAPSLIPGTSLKKVFFRPWKWPIAKLT